ncbi:MAG: two-component system response regulator [Ferruginibacter sp.]|nr:two-component system response regulator [Ferruginibacter sp.]
MDTSHILLVEDNEGDILLTTEALEETGLELKLTVLKDGEKAIDYLSKLGKDMASDLPDLIILDINLPKKNGHEVLQFIKRDGNLKHIPVIIFTSSSSEKEMKLCRDNFANTYVTKPSDVSDFMKVVGEMVKVS